MLECDFLSVSISDETPSTVCSPSPAVTTLRTDHFDVVVFSLLLSYLPVPQQRLECCCRAHRVLKLHGILLVITPDSSHQNKHAVMMKDWKTCIEAIGFHRWKYLKDTHLHCMAFRKTQVTQHDYCQLEEISHLLYIVQDKHRKSTQSADHSEPVQGTFLSHLPFYNDNDDTYSAD